jgi:hypothetical protein
VIVLTKVIACYEVCKVRKSKILENRKRKASTGEMEENEEACTRCQENASLQHRKPNKLLFL